MGCGLHLTWDAKTGYHIDSPVNTVRRGTECRHSERARLCGEGRALGTKDGGALGVHGIGNGIA